MIELTWQLVYFLDNLKFISGIMSQDFSVDLQGGCYGLGGKCFGITENLVPCYIVIQIHCTRKRPTSDRVERRPDKAEG